MGEIPTFFLKRCLHNQFLEYKYRMKTNHELFELFPDSTINEYA